MHDALRQRLLRRIESLPDAQVYQVLDFIEFLESKYAGTEPVEASGLQKFAESLEDKLRKKAVSPNTIREAFQLISAADKVLHGVSSAGKQILSDLNTALDVPEGEAGAGGEGDSPRPERSTGTARRETPESSTGSPGGSSGDRPRGTPGRAASGDAASGPGDGRKPEQQEGGTPGADGDAGA